MCGIFGIVGHPDAVSLTYLGLHALQHRGQEGAGIVSTNGKERWVHRRRGLVSEIFTPEVLTGLSGHSAIGHTRYSTTGQDILPNVQPIFVNTNFGWLSIAHNGNLVNAAEITKSLEKDGSIFQSTTDTEVIAHLVAKSGLHLPEGLVFALSKVRGAYSLLVLNNEYLIVVRDPYGFRPLVLGMLNDSPVLSSETTAFDLIGACLVREIVPGEMLVISLKNKETRSIFPFEKVPLHRCIFELIYLSRPDSEVFGASAQKIRKELGRQLAREQDYRDVDVVIPVPDSGVVAALGYAEESGIPVDMGIVRSHYVARTFIQPRQRDYAVRLKLNVVRSSVEGKRVLVLDDSLVRGTTSKKIIQMLRDAGAREVHVRIACPKTISPCYFGIDTPSKEQLIAANHSLEEVCQIIGANSLEYLSEEGLRMVVETYTGKGFCTSCFTGRYPAELL